MSEVGYLEAAAVLATALRFGINPSLDGIGAMCEELGRPQDSFDVIQVTGTNGKTSVARITDALLRAEGLASALYTSPELERYPERMEIGGSVVGDGEFARAVGAALEAAARVAMSAGAAPGAAADATEFELLTASALWLFRERGTEVAVLEVGMGGRWDATSVTTPRVAVITGVGLDHTAVLGATREAIAAEKAAIIKPGATAVLGPGVAGVEDVFRAQIARVGGHDWVAVLAADEPSFAHEELTVRYHVRSRPASPDGSTRMDVRGTRGSYTDLEVAAPAYQAGNVAIAIAAAEAHLGRALDAKDVRRAVSGVRFPGRFEMVRHHPALIVDGSHNPEAAAVLAGAIRDAWPDSAQRPLVALGILSDKDADGIVAALAPVASGFAVVAPDTPRARSAEEMGAVIGERTGVAPVFVGTLAQGLPELVRTHPGAMVITGSLATAGQARAALRDILATKLEP
ncbi:MAG: Mur ligase family protein [Coriobacteriia bacterium]|nr:Mur ligase family protein [Coriobacteriia bacterium]